MANFVSPFEKWGRRRCRFRPSWPYCTALFGSACLLFFRKKSPLHIFSILHVYWYIIIFDKIKWMHYGCIKGCLLTYLQSVTKIYLLTFFTNKFIFSFTFAIFLLPYFFVIVNRDILTYYRVSHFKVWHSKWPWGIEEPIIFLNYGD